MSDFAARMTDIFNYGALTLAMAIGYKNRIFDVLEDLNQPATIEEIAEELMKTRNFISSLII